MSSARTKEVLILIYLSCYGAAGLLLHLVLPKQVRYHCATPRRFLISASSPAFSVGSSMGIHFRAGVFGLNQARKVARAPSSSGSSVPIDDEATTQDIRLVGLLLDAIKQRWAGALGGPPRPGSPLARDLAEASTYATKRLPDPVSPAWAFSQTLGLVATNHEMILRESLLNYANAPRWTRSPSQSSLPWRALSSKPCRFRRG